MHQPQRGILCRVCRKHGSILSNIVVKPVIYSLSNLLNTVVKPVTRDCQTCQIRLSDVKLVKHDLYLRLLVYGDAAPAKVVLAAFAKPVKRVDSVKCCRTCDTHVSNLSNTLSVYCWWQVYGDAALAEARAVFAQPRPDPGPSSNPNPSLVPNLDPSVYGCRSMAMQHRPEYQLSSQSPVLTARFHPFDTHVIIGGTYSGQASTVGVVTARPYSAVLCRSLYVRVTVRGSL